jgi:hypothetical protein
MFGDSFDQMQESAAISPTGEVYFLFSDTTAPNPATVLQKLTP